MKALLIFDIFIIDLLMFRLPQDCYPADRLQSFSSYTMNNRSRSGRECASVMVKRKSMSLCSWTGKRQGIGIVRPKSSQNWRSEDGKSFRNGSKILRRKFDEEILISPSNRKFKYFVSEGSSNNIDSKMASSNFLLEPCKIESIPIQPRKVTVTQLIRPESIKYCSPYIQKVKIGTQRIGSAQSKTKLARQNAKTHHPIKNQQFLEPWESSDCYFQSIKLNPKNI